MLENDLGHETAVRMVICSIAAVGRRAAAVARRGVSAAALAILLSAALPLVVQAHDAPAKGTPVTFDLDAWRVWLGEIKSEAIAMGMKPEVVSLALKDIDPIERVIELDRRQPEFTLTFNQYVDRVVPAARVKKGRQRFQENKALLEEVGRQIGVQPRFIVALWGIETDFGRLTGGFNVINALATLAFDGRRSKYFRGELMNALQIASDGHISPPDMTGSWAGAMGQPQFMPSSFLRFAIDYDGDGQRNIWTSRADVFGSAANYLKNVGWLDDQTWGREVKLPVGFDQSLADLKVVKRMREWQTLGVRRFDGTNLPARQLEASIVIPDEESGRAFLVYENFRNILRWNRSNYFALAVGLLADGIGGR